MIRLAFPPVFCQSSRSGGLRNRLPKAFEQSGDGVEAVMAGVDPGQQGVELVGDAGLLCRGGYRCNKGADILCSHSRVKRTLYKLRHGGHKLFCPDQICQPSRVNTVERPQYVETR